MNSLEDLKTMVKNMIDALDEIETAVESTPPGPDSPEQIAKKLGKDIGAVLDPMVPLAPTKDQADAEADSQSLTRVKKLGCVIEDKLENTAEATI